MNLKRILFVDDESSVLEALARQHRKHYALSTACGSAAGLRAVAEEGPFAVLVTDFQMPGMNGTQLLARAREHDPEMIGIMLTGQADLDTAIEAVNRGHIFRFLTKPCDPEVLRGCIDAALEQRRLRHVERELLEQTVRGSIEVLAEILALANPAAFGKATRLRDCVRHMVAALRLPEGWQYETAALLSQIGCVAIPNDVLDRIAAGETLPPDQALLMQRHPELARKLLAKIPRLQAIAEMVFHQRDLAGSAPAGGPVALGARLLAAALDYEELLSLGARPAQALKALREQGKPYGPGVLDSLATAEVSRANAALQTLPLRKLRPGMVLQDDVRSTEDHLILSKGHELTEGSLQRLRNFAALGRCARDELRVSVAVGGALAA